MIDYEKTKAWRSDPVRHTYTERDTILYALGVGFAADPLVLAHRHPVGGAGL